MRFLSTATSFALGCALLATSAWAHEDEGAPGHEHPEEAPPAEEAAPGGVPEVMPGATQPKPTELPPPIKARFALNPELFGYVKAGYFLVLPPTRDAQVGSNSGFQLINARLGVTLRPVEKLEAVLSVDGASSERQASDPLRGERIVSLRDAYIEYAAMNVLRIRAGQFKAPFNGETLLPDQALPFIQRSVLSHGILPPEGQAQEGLALDRQVGIQLSSERLGDAVGFEYAVAVVNGNGPNRLFNDNNSVTPVARVAVSYRDLVSVGANGYYNVLSLGPAPRITETHLAYGGDVTVTSGGLNVMAMFLLRDVGHPDTDLPSEQGMGAMASVRYLVEDLGLEAGARIAWYEPSDALTFDQRTELTAMVGYRAATFPARILLQYTHRLEDAAVEIGNNSVDVLAQITF